MESTDRAIHALIRKGATLTFSADPNSTNYPVAWWRRVNANRHFYHNAGTSDLDHHVLEFTSEQIFHDGLGVGFMDEAGELAAYLTEIQEAEFDSVRAEQIAAQIARWKAEFDSDPLLRAAVLNAYKQSG